MKLNTTDIKLTHSFFRGHIAFPAMRAQILSDLDLTRAERCERKAIDWLQRCPLNLFREFSKAAVGATAANGSFVRTADIKYASKILLKVFAGVEILLLKNGYQHLFRTNSENPGVIPVFR
ncbi:hypothetical protein OS189_02790 [Sulfitobacter sp. F26169L]|nr:hypothetical protein [Sulfitobacter sp. F26169L]